MAGAALIWQRRHLPVCASTEVELTRWLAARAAMGRPLPEGNRALAVIARRQRFGVGQRGRVWQSPAGGLWLSAALPWPAAAAQAAPLALAAAVGLAMQLEGLGLRPSLKWPNDLLLGGRKLAGVLPRLRWRQGQVRWAQVGVGLNGVNRVPLGAISVAEALRLQGSRRRAASPLAQPPRLEAPVLAALGWAAAAAADPLRVLAEAEARLWRPPGGWRHGGRLWQVQGLASTGGLRLTCGADACTLERRG